MRSESININGVARPLRPDQRRIAIANHISGGVELTVGREVVIMSPRDAFGMAQGILGAIGYKFVEKIPDDLPG